MDNSRRDVKKAFVLAEMLKDEACRFTTEEDFRSQLGLTRHEVNLMNEESLNDKIEDKARLKYFNHSNWEFHHNLCFLQLEVWGCMGNMSWVKVGDTVKQVKNQIDDYSNEINVKRIKNMKRFARIFQKDLPIIYTKNYHGESKINDGSHRAVAMALAGIEKADVWVGTL